MFTSVSSRSASAYKRVSLETSVSQATPHQLVHMLFENLLRNVGAARLAIQSRNIAAKGEYIQKAVRIIDEGLKPALNLKDGGVLADNLSRMYSFCLVRLTEANLQSAEQPLIDILRVIEPLADGWKGIGDQVAH